METQKLVGNTGSGRKRVTLQREPIWRDLEPKDESFGNEPSVFGNEKPYKNGDQSGLMSKSRVHDEDWYTKRTMLNERFTGASTDHHATFNPRQFATNDESKMWDEKRTTHSSSSSTPSMTRLLNDYFTESSPSRGDNFERMLLPPKAYSYWTGLEDLKRVYNLKLEREAFRLKADMDLFIDSLVKLFEEIKKILISHLSHNEFDFKDVLMNYSSVVDRYLKDSHIMLTEERRRNQYYTLDLRYNTEGESLDDNSAQLVKQRRVIDSTENALKQIKALREKYQINLMTEMLEGFVRDEKPIYNNKVLRRNCMEVRDELLQQVESMDLFKENYVISKIDCNLFNLALANDSKGKFQGNDLPTKTEAVYKPEPRIILRNNDNQLDKMKEKLNDSLLEKSANENMLDETINSILTENRLKKHKISTNITLLHQRGGMNQISTPLLIRPELPEKRSESPGSLKQSAALSMSSKERKKWLEDRERDFQKRLEEKSKQTGKDTWGFMDSLQQNFYK
jgi:hypothetical protein